MVQLQGLPSCRGCKQTNGFLAGRQLAPCVLLVVCLAQVESTADIVNAKRLIFPGVGAFGQAMDILQQRGYTQALKDYIQVGGGRWGGVRTHGARS